MLLLNLFETVFAIFTDLVHSLLTSQLNWYMLLLLLYFFLLLLLMIHILFNFGLHLLNLSIFNIIILINVKFLFLNSFILTNHGRFNWFIGIFYILVFAATNAKASTAANGATRLVGSFQLIRPPFLSLLMHWVWFDDSTSFIIFKIIICQIGQLAPNCLCFHLWARHDDGWWCSSRVNVSKSDFSWKFVIIYGLLSPKWSLIDWVVVFKGLRMANVFKTMICLNSFFNNLISVLWLVNLFLSWLIFYLSLLIHYWLFLVYLLIFMLVVLFFKSFGDLWFIKV